MIAETDGRLWPVTACIPTEDTEEAAWVSRARAGDQAAYSWLLARYRLRAVRLATHVLRRPDEAEDAAQEAFIRAFRNIRAFRGEGKFYTWLYHIVVRVCLDRRRLARWKTEIRSGDLDMPFDALAPSLSEHADTKLMVEHLLDRLTPPMRAALVLREMEGLEYEEISKVLEIPVGTVRSRLNSARAQFRLLYQAALLEADHV
jgi:RNA polymerase sigma-70 factor (ECF subfamily)